MRSKIKAVREYLQSDYRRSTAITSAVSALINIVFAMFNGFLGAVYHSLWNGSICVYYLLLAVIRIIIIGAQRKEIRRKRIRRKTNQTAVCISTHLLLMLMDISLIVPTAVMVKGGRSYTYGLIPAIAMAAYTTYRVTMGIIQLRKSLKMKNLLVAELRMINFTDALLALLSLQNALIIATDGMDSDMIMFTAWTSAAILAVIYAVTIHSFVKTKRAG